MTLTDLTPLLHTKDLEGTIKWYTENLEFKCHAHNKEIGWINMSHGKLSIMFSLPNAHIPFEKPTCTGSFYFNTADVDILWAKLKDKVKVCYPIEDFDYGMREFAVHDNNGYLLQFGKEI
jgi:uncharacterized glyoxalase superfamily protein PhnB